MNLNQKIIRIITIVLTIGIISFLASYSVILVHNTEDPYFAKKIALITIGLILVSIVAGGFVLYCLRGKKKGN
jgi:TRAP-type C4-dicarboxylate transport system permease small subunit